MSDTITHEALRPFLPIWLRERLGAQDLVPGAAFHYQATIVYADLSGFSRLTSAFSTLPDGAERLHLVLNQAYAVLIETIARFGGDIMSIAGDALTAWWPERVDVELARRCADALLTALASLPPADTPLGPFQLLMRIGIAAGPVSLTLAGMPGNGVYPILSGPALQAATQAEREAMAGTMCEAEPLSSITIPSNTIAPDVPTAALDAAQFLPKTFVDRLRSNTLVAEYRRCVPVFAAFDLPRRPSELHRLVVRAQTIIGRWGGWLNEVEIGDKGAVFVILFGAPLAYGDDPRRAAACALELLAQGLISRAGISVGTLFAGAVGSGERGVYTAQGEEMNLAANLMDEAAVGTILVSGRIRSELAARYRFGSPAAVYIKGVASVSPVPLLGPLVAEAQGARLVPDAALIGREAERAQLAQQMERALAGRARTLVVSGEIGIGKSALLQFLLGRWMERGLTALVGVCHDASPPPLAVWRPIIFELIGVDDASAQASALAAELDLIGHGLAFPIVAGLLGLSIVAHDQASAEHNDVAHISQWPVRDSTALSPGESAADVVLVANQSHGEPHAALDSPSIERALRAIADLLREHARRTPLLLVLEDLQRADSFSLRLVLRLAEMVALRHHIPLLCAVSWAANSESLAPALQAIAARAAAHLTLGPLTDQDSDALARVWLGVAALHPSLREQITRYTEGHPFFIKEYVRALREQNLLSIEDDVAVVVQQPTLRLVADNAYSLAQAQIDQLDEAARTTLKVAAVIGRSFSADLLFFVHPARPSRAELQAQLEELLRFRLIELEIAGPEPLYRFRQPVVHDAVYISLLFRQRRRLHASVAHWYERVYSAEIEARDAPLAVYDVLIEHARRAEDFVQLARYSEYAAERAARQQAALSALGYIDMAISLVDEPRQRFRLILLRVMLNERLGNLFALADDLGELDRLSEQIEQAVYATAAAYYRLSYRVALDMPQTALNGLMVLGRCLRRALRDPDRSAMRQGLLFRAAALNAQGMAYAATGYHDQARRCVSYALEQARSLEGGEPSNGPLPLLFEPRSIAAHCLTNLSDLSLVRGARDEALRFQREALALALNSFDWHGEARARAGLGRLYALEGDLFAAQHYSSTALSIYQKIGDRRGQALTLCQLAQVANELGDYHEAQRDAMHALALSNAIQARTSEGEALRTLAAIARAQGNEDEAQAAEDEASRL
jgi:class 3 adenylate cyclase/tetratricopeptide (TPR) repeat protein